MNKNIEDPLGAITSFWRGFLVTLPQWEGCKWLQVHWHRSGDHIWALCLVEQLKGVRGWARGWPRLRYSAAPSTYILLCSRTEENIYFRVSRYVGRCFMFIILIHKAPLKQAYWNSCLQWWPLDTNLYKDKPILTQRKGKCMVWTIIKCNTISCVL